MLVDSHCHLDFPEFAEELDAVVARAEAAGVRTLVTICTRVSRAEQVLRLVEPYPSVWCALGVHPHQVAEEGIVEVATLVELARHPKVVGIGETGLDYYYDKSPRDAQRESFRRHIEAARETGLPFIVHTRNADADTARILDEAIGRGPVAGLLHCFSSSRQLAETSLDLGLYISFSGIVTFRNAAEVREVAGLVPDERVLVETDAPFLAPVPLRGKRNEPAFVVHTAAAVAALRATPIARFEALTTENFFRLFSKATPPCG